MAHEINIIVTVSFEDNKDGVEKKGKEKNREVPVYGSIRINSFPSSIFKGIFLYSFHQTAHLILCLHFSFKYS